MSDPTNDTDKPWIATLKRGSSFTLGVNPAQRFTKNADTPIDDDTKARLEEKAVDMIDKGDRDDDGFPILEPHCKFDFRRQGEAPKQRRVAAPRARSRA